MEKTKTLTKGSTMTGETLRKAQEILDGLSMVELGRALSATSKETESLLYNQILIAIAKK